MKLFSLFALVAYCLLFPIAQAVTSEWSELRGPTARGVFEAEDLPMEWDREKNVVWKTKIPGRGWSSPLVIQGKVILTSGMDEAVDGMHDLKVLQLDANTGNIIWKKRYCMPHLKKRRTKIRRTVWPVLHRQFTKALFMRISAIWVPLLWISIQVKRSGNRRYHTSRKTALADHPLW